tara:strand:+ start:168 stop:290 length:123 start_codon:yes stop_codon:yes gene_type:complete
MDLVGGFDIQSWFCKKMFSLSVLNIETKLYWYLNKKGENR